MMARRRARLPIKLVREYEARGKRAIHANFMELDAARRKTVAEHPARMVALKAELDAGFEARHIARQERDQCLREWRKQWRREDRQMERDERREIGAQNLACLIECLEDMRQGWVE
jgi:hypothetical protein